MRLDGKRRAAGGLAIVLTMILTGTASEVRGQVTANEFAKLTATDQQAYDQLGYSLAISGDTAIVGARHDDNSHGTQAGSAYIFTYDGATWNPGQKLVGTEVVANDSFGQSVSISGDTAVIGAPYDDVTASNAGAAYVFRYNGSTWVQEEKLLASDGAALDYFGWSVGVAEDVAVIGAYGNEAAYVFRYNGTTGGWDEEATLPPSDPSYGARFGHAVAIYGNTAVVGAPFRETWGVAYVFRYGGSSWGTQEEARLAPGDGANQDEFGNSVAIWGDVVVVGAPEHDAVAGDSGAAYVYRYDSGSSAWPLDQKLVPGDGDLNDAFGYSVATAGNAAVIGALRDEPNGPYSGSAYAFVYDPITPEWVEVAKLVPSDGARDDDFGYSVSMSGATAIVGAMGDDVDTGAAYAYGGFSDCDGDGILDITQIVGGSLEDLDGNGVPDTCGACCTSEGCTQVIASACEMIGDYMGNGTACEQAVCTTLPAVSKWGLVTMVLVILAASSLVFVRRRAVDR